MKMHLVVLTVLLCISFIEAQFSLPLLSQFLPINSPLTPNTGDLFHSPSSSSHVALSSRQPHNLDTVGLNVPPPLQQIFHASPKLEDGPLRVLKFVGSDDQVQPPFGRVDVTSGDLVSEESTSKPFIATPTTIRFTIEDVPHFLEPSVLPTQSNIDITTSSFEEDSLEDSLSILDNPLDYDTQNNDQGNILSPLSSKDPQQHLFILTSTENVPDSSTLRPSTPFIISGNPFKRNHSSSTLSSILQKSNTNFRPSLSLPFLDHSFEEPQNLFTLVETRNPRVSSFLRSEAPHFLESRPKVFALRPIKVESEDVTKTHVQEPTNIPILRKTPVPKPIFFSEEGEDDNQEQGTPETVTKADKSLTTLKTFHFEQEFLSLLKKNNQIEKSQLVTTESSFKPNPFWFSEQSGSNTGIWRLKGGVRAPSLDLLPEASLASQIALKNNLGGLFATSIRGLSSITKENEESLKILDDIDDSLTTEGIAVKSLAQEGLSKDLIKVEKPTVTPIILHHNVSETSLKLKNIFDKSTTKGVTSHGPQIVPVGEVGEVPHEIDGATISPVPTLSASLKHGVQSLNVTAWVTGCPKLYGKVELNCVIEHDAISNTAMTLTWKKKSFTEGRPQEHIMTENDLLMMEDSRFSLEHHHDRYVLAIKDFRPKDCGTYECEAKAADTRASSQLLLFTCL